MFEFFVAFVLWRFKAPTIWWVIYTVLLIFVLADMSTGVKAVGVSV